jgi:endonuclease III-like uncharacterized protein
VLEPKRSRLKMLIKIYASYYSKLNNSTSKTKQEYGAITGVGEEDP